MSKNTVVKFTRRDNAGTPLSELLRQSAREMIQQAVEAELTAFLGNNYPDKGDLGCTGFRPRPETLSTGNRPDRLHCYQSPASIS